MLLATLRLFIFYKHTTLCYNYMERYAAALGGLMPKYVEVKEPYMHV
jgi:hypothetical protein